MRFHNINHFQNRPIQSSLLLTGCLIGSVIFNGHGIRKHIVRKYLSVSVKNPASGTGNAHFFPYLHGKTFHILLSVNNLQHKNTAHQNAEKSAEQNHQHKYTGSNKT